MPNELGSRREGERLFLSAEWRNLVMLNYEVDPAMLRAKVPRGTELDSFGGRTYVSLVGFRFLRTKLFGALPLPFHINFDEVNLRFYVRRLAEDGVRRGVVFIREIVPRRAVAWIARMAYNENYTALPMRHRLSASGNWGAGVDADSRMSPGGDSEIRVEYEWEDPKSGRGAWSKIYAESNGTGRPAIESSVEQFISEHYWGYTAQRDGGCVEYRVAHPSWHVWQSARAGFEGNGVPMYGEAFGAVLRRAPDSAFIADGSAVEVFAGARIA